MIEKVRVIERRFKLENEHFQHFVFKPIENLEKFKQDIHRKESLGIHQYAIQPLGHDKKPEDGETLIAEELI
jgi:hypothetical protein